MAADFVSELSEALDRVAEATGIPCAVQPMTRVGHDTDGKPTSWEGAYLHDLLTPPERCLGSLSIEEFGKAGPTGSASTLTVSLKRAGRPKVLARFDCRRAAFGYALRIVAIRRIRCALGLVDGDFTPDGVEA